jgi:methyl-accepting chemotaxis protein
VNLEQLLDERPWFRLLQILTGIMALILTTIILFALIGERLMMRRLVEHEGELLAAAVQGAMSESLAIGDSEAVNEQFAALRETVPDVEIYVFDGQGLVSFATNPESVGTELEQVTSSELNWTGSNESSDEPWRETSFEEEVAGVPTLSVVRPILNAPRCHHCHGSSRELLGGILVRSSTKRAKRAIRNSRNLNIMVGLFGLGGGLLLMRRMLVRVVRELLRDVITGGEVMAASSADLTTVFTQLSKDSVSAAGRSESVANSVASVNEGLSSIAVSMEESSAATDAINVAVEQMTSSVGEIAREAAGAAKVTGEAAARADEATAMIAGLGDEADEIGSVIKVINSISEQINLLALNATIESARAGQAGRGFAVVADEIKKLARETSEATTVIQNRIGGIQESTAGLVHQVEGFSELMGTVNATVSTIAAAVEEQVAVTDEIASGVSHSSAGVRQTTADVSSISEGLHDISSNASEVNVVATAVSDSSATISERAGELAELAAKMNQLIARFKI